MEDTLPIIIFTLMVVLKAMKKDFRFLKKPRFMSVHILVIY